MDKEKVIECIQYLKVTMMQLHDWLYGECGCNGTCSFHQLNKYADKVIKEIEKELK